MKLLCQFYDLHLLEKGLMVFFLNSSINYWAFLFDSIEFGNKLSQKETFLFSYFSKLGACLSSIPCAAGV
jgi:hypothetical protein